MKKFKALDTEILAINPASVKSHDSYCNKKGFTFTLLSDQDRSTTQKYQALKSNGKSIQRMVYVVQPKGEILFVEKGMPANNKILQAIKDAQK